MTKPFKELCTELREKAAQNKCLFDSEEILPLLDALDELSGALEFYGYEAIHNPEAKSKTEQYWNDAGIWDHGDRARNALQKVYGQVPSEHECPPMPHVCKECET